PPPSRTASTASSTSLLVRVLSPPAACSEPLDRWTNPTCGSASCPACAAEIVCECFEAVCVLRDEFDIEDRLAAVSKRRVMRLQHQLHDTLEGCDIAADADQTILAGDPRLAKGCHLERILRRGKPFERALAQWVEHHNRHPATRRVV